ncbi:autoinducer binding domain-containing protein [Ideonella sp. DXS22W]|uniref:Autoinducer binding domain-containing protein n=1 Tax=Pseudaquabacterium inlustre TaxID=2984192 RepID=A0ABU9CBS3_9BURK
MSNATSDDPTRPHGLPRLIVAPQIAELAGCTTTREMRDGLKKLASALGFDVAIAAIEDWRGFGSPIRHLVSTLPDAWSEMYLARSLYRHSPVVQHCRASTDAMVWVAQRRMHEAPEYWSTALQHGMAEGVSLSSHRPQSLALLTLARREGPFSAAADPPAVPLEYSMLPRMAHDCLLKIVHAERMPIAEHQFSDRELECLHWSARGKTSAETAQLLHLSEATVNFHLQRVMAKLSASNRQQAVAIATAMGLFNDSLKRHGQQG